ncbi:MAG: 4-hydroxythreonine-4-phosphate dehydrogenase PdxA [Pseudomonadota bacterium]
MSEPGEASRALPRLIITAGEPAGIGPELCLKAALKPLPARLVVAGDADLLQHTSDRLNIGVAVSRVEGDPPPHKPGCLNVLHVPLVNRAVPGRPDSANATSVLATLDLAVEACLVGRFDAMVTAPLSKAVISDSGIPFTGHTEYLAERTGAPLPVMLLCAGELRVALATTHLPLRDVSDAITADRLEAVIRVLHTDLQRRFGLTRPRIVVCGLNPHAGEGGHLGREEIEVMIPALDTLKSGGIDVVGPLPADTAFTPRALQGVDAVLAMFHDQGLPVLKYAGFGHAVNVTMGLPLVRTSVDHGTAFDLAGTGRADAGSLLAAIDLAMEIARR